ncbi:MAG: TcpQ domain-containing protein [Desulfovibrionaceae bacterium]|nr:TcpQ domain-containing protein [Desulfovibrionaceae bacterium]
MVKGNLITILFIVSFQIILTQAFAYYSEDLKPTHNMGQVEPKIVEIFPPVNQEIGVEANSKILERDLEPTWPDKMPLPDPNPVPAGMANQSKLTIFGRQDAKSLALGAQEKVSAETYDSRSAQKEASHKQGQDANLTNKDLGEGSLVHLPKDHTAQNASHPLDVQKRSPAKHTPKKVTLTFQGTGKSVAQYYHLNVRDFCAWNHFGPNTPLPKGYEVYLSQPDPDSLILANVSQAPLGFDERKFASTSKSQDTRKGKDSRLNLSSQVTEDPRLKNDQKNLTLVDKNLQSNKANSRDALDVQKDPSQNSLDKKEQPKNRFPQTIATKTKQQGQTDRQDQKLAEAKRRNIAANMLPNQLAIQNEEQNISSLTGYAKEKKQTRPIKRQHSTHQSTHSNKNQLSSAQQNSTPTTQHSPHSERNQLSPRSQKQTLTTQHATQQSTHSDKKELSSAQHSTHQQRNQISPTPQKRTLTTQHSTQQSTHPAKNDLAQRASKTTERKGRIPAAQATKASYDKNLRSQDPNSKGSNGTDPNAKDLSATFGSTDQSLPDFPVKNTGQSFFLTPGRFSTQLERWCQQGGYRLVWKAKTDLNIKSSTSFGSDFEQALSLVLKSLESQGFELTVTVYALNHVVEVEGE